MVATEEETTMSWLDELIKDVLDNAGKAVDSDEEE